MNSTGKLNGESVAVNNPEEDLSLGEVCAKGTWESRWVRHETTFRGVRAEIPCRSISSLVCHLVTG